MAILSAGIGPPPRQKPKERTLSGTSRDAAYPGDIIPVAGEIISERRAKSNPIGERHHLGFASDFPRYPQLVGEIFEIERSHRPFEADMEFVDLAL
jgi:hypothetical protein